MPYDPLISPVQNLQRALQRIRPDFSPVTPETAVAELAVRANDRLEDLSPEVIGAIPADEDGKLPADRLPDEIDARIEVLSGGTSALLDAALGEGEIAVDTDKGHPVFGGGAGAVIDPFDNLRVPSHIALYSMQDLVMGSGASQPQWERMFKAVITKTTSPALATLRTTTGYAKGLRWDGTWTAVGGTGSPGGSITLNWGTAPASPYNARIPKFIAVTSCDVSGNFTGNITSINISGQEARAVDVSGLSQLTELDVTGNRGLTDLDVSGCPLLTVLYAGFTGLRALDVSGLPALEGLVVSNTKLTSLDVSWCPNLTALEVDYTTTLKSLRLGVHNQLTTLSLSMCPVSSLDLSNCPYLETFVAGQTNLLTLDLSNSPSLLLVTTSGSPLLQSVNISGCADLVGFYADSCGALSEIRCVGCRGGALSTFHDHWRFTGCNLSGAALDQIYTDLAVAATTGAVIQVNGNPGTSSDDPTIATAKGYVIVGT